MQEAGGRRTGHRSRIRSGTRPGSEARPVLGAAGGVRLLRGHAAGVGGIGRYDNQVDCRRECRIRWEGLQPHRFVVRVPPAFRRGEESRLTEGGMDGSVQQACMDSLFGGAKSEPTGEWTEIDLNGISRWQKQDDGAADIIWKSAD